VNNKILQINSSSNVGGGPQVMWDISQGLNIFFDFIILAPKGFFIDKYKEAGFKVNILTGLKFFKIRQEIKKERPTIIHAHGTRAATCLFFKGRPKIVYTVHGFHILRKNFVIRFFLLNLEKFLNYWTDVLICVGRGDEELVLKRGVIPSRKVKVIRNGIELEKFNLSPDLIGDKRNELGLKAKFILVSVGRLHPQKDFLTLINAVDLLKEKIIGLKVLIIGDGPLREKLEQEVERLELRDKILFLGKRDDVPGLMGLSDGVILSTNWEGLALVPLEAGASRKVIIASRVGGVEESILDGETGFLFEKGSHKELAEKIKKLYKSSEQRKKMGERAHKYVLDNFSREKMIEEYKKLYNSLIKTNVLH